MKTLLLTGASGFLGYNFLQLDLNEWNIVALVHQNELKNRNVKQVACDISDLSSLKNTFSEINPDAVVHLAALSNANFCEENAPSTYQVNVSASVCLAELCANRNIPFLFTSTDLVFDGKKGNYTETDTTAPLMAYGKQKAEAEHLIFEKHQNACILRMPLMFGSGGSFIMQDIAKLKSGQTINLFTDEYRSIVGGMSAAKGIKLALDNNWKGINHLGGKEKISRYEFGLIVCDTFGFDKSLLISKLQSEVTMAAPRPNDVTLNSEKAYRLGYAPLKVSEELKSLKGIIQF
jgi:dTDP-4-dehydrorhamnose reductase